MSRVAEVAKVAPSTRARESAGETQRLQRSHACPRNSTDGCMPGLSASGDSRQRSSRSLDHKWPPVGQHFLMSALGGKRTLVSPSLSAASVPPVSHETSRRKRQSYARHEHRRNPKQRWRQRRIGPLCFSCRRYRSRYETSGEAVRNRVRDEPWASAPWWRYWCTLRKLPPELKCSRSI
jgi:hypothetical protein